MYKYRKKNVPHPRMQFDDKNRVEKAKKRSVVKQIEAKNRVELFRHLLQYEHGTRLLDLESKFFQLDIVHPAVYKHVDKPLKGKHSTKGLGKNVPLQSEYVEWRNDVVVPCGKPTTSNVRTSELMYNEYIVYNTAQDLQVITGSHDSTIKFWDLRTCKTMLTHTHHKKSVRAMAPHPKEITGQ